MKKYLSQITMIISLGVLLLSNGGCAKIADFGDTNVDPNGVSEPILSALLTNILGGTAGIATYTTSNAPSYMCQYRAESTYPGVSKYSGLNIEASGNYSGAMADCQVIINKCNEPAFIAKAAKYGDVGTQTAVALLLKTYMMWNNTDRWGDLPYSEALQGAANLLPKYDEQKDIYTAMFDDIERSLTLLNPAGVTISGDIMYGGDVAKWGKFANSMRMIMAMRLTKRYPNAGEYAAVQFNKSLTNSYGYISTNADNFALKYYAGALRSPFAPLSTSQDEAVALTFTDALNNMGDTRRQSMASLANGCPYGLTNAAPIGTPYARLFSGVYAADDATVVFLSAGSVLLARAEAIERGWAAGNARAVYEAGVTASFEQWGKTVPAGYLTGGVADYETGTGGGSIGGSSVAGSNANTNTRLQRIALQQWIAFYPSGIQGWSNWRRTGTPDIKPTVFYTSTLPQIPRRYTYGTSDYTNNKAGVDAAVARIPGGVDSQDAKMWWDQ